MKHFLFTYTFFLLSIGLYSQKDLTYDSSEGLQEEISVCRSITLSNGFTFNSASGKRLSLSINPNLCNPYDKDRNISNDQNYIHTRTYTNDEGSTFLDVIQYFDGLGRPNQTVQVAATPSPNLHDLVSVQEYDGLGRESKAWLPAPISGNGAYVNNVTSLIQSFYNQDNPYSMPEYEAAPLSRMTRLFGPGKDWHEKGKSVETRFIFEEGSEFYFEGFGVEMNQLKKSSSYYSRNFSVIEVKDEDGNLSYEVKDKLGLTVMTRQVNNDDNHDTYFVYDNSGNLCYVLPPILSDKIIKEGKSVSDDGVEMQQYAYIYKYDKQNRCIKKRLPGCEPIYYVYDKSDRLIFSQDGEQRSVGQWTYNLYDDFGRLTVSGYWDWAKANHEDLINGLKDIVVCSKRGRDSNNDEYAINGALEDIDYQTNVPGFGAKFSSYVFRIVNYYDNYDLPPGMGRYLADSGMPNGFAKIYPSAKGFQTMSMEFTSEAGELATILYYDERGRMIKHSSSNHLGGIDREFIKYNFTGQVVYRLLVHGMLSEHDEVREEYWYTYDHVGRLTETSHSLDEATPIVLAKNEYDELGRLKTTKINNQDKLKTAYDYNIRSWIKNINSGNTFSESLAYTYSGNISDTEITNNITYASKFKYDGLSRLESSQSDILSQNIQDANYDTSYSYDKHGNFKFIKRRFSADILTGIMDDLEINYIGNQIKTVHEWEDGVLGFLDSSDADIQYTYNRNGALLTDLNKGMVIEYDRYNSFQTPYSIHVDNYFTKGQIYYRYSSSGQKLSSDYSWNNKQSSFPMGGASGSNGGSKITQYVGNRIYDGDDIDPRLERILIDNGYIDYATKKYYFYLHDHLGNNCVVADWDGNVVQRTNYYPFGLPMEDSTDEEIQPYKYNGKEYETIAGINLYDYHARQHDPILGRFTSIDPLAEKYYNISPYAYVGNNPMAFIDPNGQRRLGVVPEVGVDPEEEDGESYYTEDQSSIEAILDYIFERVTGTSNLYDTSKIKDHQDRIAADMKNLQTRTAALEQSAQTVNTVADVLASVIPFGSVVEAGNKVSYGQKLSGGDIAFAAMDIIPMGVVGKVGKAAKSIDKGRRLWQLTDKGASIIKNHSKFGTIYKSSSDGLWWAVDNASHGGSAFKVFKENNKGLIWYKDADKYGDFITNKHKGNTGLFIPWGHIKTIK